MQCWRECQNMSDRIPGKMSGRMPRHILEYIAQFFFQFLVVVSREVAGRTCTGMGKLYRSKLQNRHKTAENSASSYIECNHRACARGKRAKTNCYTFRAGLGGLPRLRHGWRAGCDWNAINAPPGLGFLRSKVKKHQHHFFKIKMSSLI